MDSLSGDKVASNVLGGSTEFNDKLPIHFITFYPAKDFIKNKNMQGYVLIKWTKA